MELKARFDVVILEEAQNFIDSLDEKVRYKIEFNINASRYVNDSDLFKKLNDNIWELRLSIMEWHIGYLLFGTKIRER